MDAPRATPAAHATAPTILGVESATANALLLLMARTLQETVLPALEGKPRSAVQDCITIATRVAHQLAAEGTEPVRLLRSALESEGPQGTPDWLRRVQAEGAAIDQSEVEALQVVASLAEPTPAVRATSGEAIEAYLRGHPMGGAGLRVTAAKRLSGGRSKQTLLISQEGSAHLPPTFVVRQDWLAAQQEWAKDATSAVQTEFEVLKFAFGLGMRVPEPLFVEPNPSALGAPFLVVAPMPGKQEGDLFFPPTSEALALQVAEQMAILHRATSQQVSDLAEVAKLRLRSHSIDDLRTTLASWREFVARFDAPSHTIAVGLDWLEHHLPADPGHIGVVHGDIGFHNLLVDGEHLTAVLDWEMAHLGAAAQDLGYVRSGIEKMTRWDTFLAAYRAAGGPEVNAEAVDFYTLWGSLWLYTTLLQARAGLVAGMLRDSEVAVFCVHFMPVLRQRISTELRAILSRQGALA